MSTADAAAADANAARNSHLKLRIEEELKDVRVLAGEELSLHSRVTSPAGSRVSWLRDGQRLLPAAAADRLQLKQNPTGICECHLSAARIEDSGLYSIRVLAPDGQCVQSSASVTVVSQGIAASFKESLPAQKSVQQGRSLLLRCRCVGQPTPTLRWLRDGRLLPSAAAASVTTSSYCTGSGSDGDHWLEIDAAQLSDAAQYSAIAANSHGEAITHCAVHVVESTNGLRKSSDVDASIITNVFAPHFAHDISEHMHAHVNDKLTMNCKVNGHPTPTVTWLKGSQTIDSNESFVLSVQEGMQQLTIPKVTFEHAGVYRIVATNSAGMAECCCELRVEEEPSETEDDDEEFEGEESLLSLRSDTVSALASASSEFAFIASASSEFAHAAAGDSRPPEFLQVFHDVFCHTDDTVQLVCELAHCYPQPKIKWTLNEQEIMESTISNCSAIQNGRQLQLSISSVQPANAGRYCVRAENDCGSASCAALVIVQDSTNAVSFERVIECSSFSDDKSSKCLIQVWKSSPNSLLLSG